MKYYSKTTEGFYDKDIHKTNIPADAVEVEDHVWNDLLNKQAQGMRIVAGVNGYPVAVIYTQTDAERDVDLRARIARDLQETDSLISQYRDEVDLGEPTVISEDQYKALLAWRSALRKLPQTPGWPNVDLPERPV